MKYKKVNEFSVTIEDVYPKDYYPPTTWTEGPSIVIRARSRKMKEVTSVLLCATISSEDYWMKTEQACLKHLSSLVRIIS